MGDKPVDRTKAGFNENRIHVQAGTKDRTGQQWNPDQV